jgi:hypothetical protein
MPQTALLTRGDNRSRRRERDRKQRRRQNYGICVFVQWVFSGLSRVVVTVARRGVIGLMMLSLGFKNSKDPTHQSGRDKLPFTSSHTALVWKEGCCPEWYLALCCSDPRHTGPMVGVGMTRCDSPRPSTRT